MGVTRTISETKLSYPKTVYSRQIIPIATIPITRVATVYTRSMTFIPTPENREMTQKYESLAWDTIIEPAPIARTVKTLPMVWSSPNEGSIGNTMVAVVIMATDEDPWAVFKMAAIRKGKKSPIWLTALLADTCSAI